MRAADPRVMGVDHHELAGLGIGEPDQAHIRNGRSRGSERYRANTCLLRSAASLLVAVILKPR
jgi:hypothetical protein